MTPETKEWLEHLEELLITTINVLVAEMPIDAYPARRLRDAIRHYNLEMEGL